MKRNLFLMCIFLLVTAKVQAQEITKIKFFYTDSRQSLASHPDFPARMSKTLLNMTCPDNIYYGDSDSNGINTKKFPNRDYWGVNGMGQKAYLAHYCLCLDSSEVTKKDVFKKLSFDLDTTYSMRRETLNKSGGVCFWNITLQVSYNNKKTDTISYSTVHNYLRYNNFIYECNYAKGDNAYQNFKNDIFDKWLINIVPEIKNELLRKKWDEFIEHHLEMRKKDKEREKEKK